MKRDREALNVLFCEEIELECSSTMEFSMGSPGEMREIKHERDKRDNIGQPCRIPRKHSVSQFNRDQG